MIRLEKPTPAELLDICRAASADDQREWGSTHFGGWNPELIATTCGFYLEGVAHVFRDGDGTPYCASGFYAVAPGVARSWTIRTEAWKRHLRECVRVSRFVIGLLMESDGVHRIEAWCPAWAPRWPEALGLEREAVLRRYASDGSDLVIWSKVRA